MNGRTRTAFAAFAVAVTGFSLFAVATIWLQLRRERKRVDATLLHWWTAMSCALAAAVGWALNGQPVPIGILLLFGIGVGLPAGMLFKIVPFLAWFHLHHRQLASGRLEVRVPNMLKFLPEKWARVQFAIHLVTLMGLVGAWVTPAFSYFAAAAVAMAAIALGGLILIGGLRYRRIASALAPP